MKKKPEGHVNHERWLVSYADFITLLFAFFVVMYAMSQADAKKFKQVAASLQQSLKGVPPQAVGGPPLKTDLPDDTHSTGSGKTAAQRLQETAETLQAGLSMDANEPSLADRVQLLPDPDAGVLRVSVFDSSADRGVATRDELLPILDRVGRVIAAQAEAPRIRVEGFTETSEETEGSGWELSSARAAWLVRYWVKKFALDPARFRVVGFSHYRPAAGAPAAHSAAQGVDWERGRNRRIEIVFEP